MFEAKDKQIIYIGKAKNLKNRLNSYLLKTNQVGKTKQLINSAKTIRWVEVDSELQAIILEAQLIKTFQPKFNLRLRDDKSPLYIIITNEKFPRVLTSRKPSATSYEFTPSEVAELQATSYFGPFSSATQTKSILKFARRAFPFCNATLTQKKRQQACFYSHIGLCGGACIGNVTTRSYRAMIRRLAQFLSGNQDQLISALTKKMHSAAKKQQYEGANEIKNQLQAIIHLAQTQADSHFTDEVISKTKQNQALQELQQALHLPSSPRRIECYDIANLQGQFATGAMVVAKNGELDTSEYRHFKIRTLNTPHDPGMIAETIRRRLSHPEWEIPDLILVDGGITQVNAALSVTNHYPLVTNHCKVIGLAKRQETIVTLKGEINLPRHSPSLQLLQCLRDEAHRFSRKLHHHLHLKTIR